MIEPNFKEMSREELIAYVKKHRTDSKAVRELFFNRRSPDETATWYPAPLDERSVQIMEEAFREKLGLPPTPSS